jgi:hypothetical protein
VENNKYQNKFRAMRETWWKIINIKTNSEQCERLGGK